MEQKKYFDILQIYRGIAALLVVIHCTYASFAHFSHLDIIILMVILDKFLQTIILKDSNAKHYRKHIVIFLNKKISIYVS